MDADEVERFWSMARDGARLTSLPGYLPSTMLEMVPPPTWSFGAGPEQADALLALVLQGQKTATASARADYDAADEPLPEVGTLGIVLDGAGRPRALLETTDVSVVAFDQVPDEHAHAEGEGDRTLAHWRAVHERFFLEGGHDVGPDLLVVLERFRVLHRA
ncbi:MAG: ASCH domain-containing protein [Nocardioides sp.]|nr:ASCH domain-containing protein [Nocardioides sp.]